MWQVVKHCSGGGSKRKFISEVNNNGSTLKDPEMIASAFNDHSIALSAPVAGQCYCNLPGSLAPGSLFLAPALEDEILGALNAE